MSRTIYQPENGDFSNKAHLAARRLIYPRIFDVTEDCIEYEDTLLGDSERGTVYDAELGIDRILKVKTDECRMPLKVTVQERFRRPEFAHWKDVTITEWNGASGMPSELYKITSGFFVYGYYDYKKDIFLDSIAFYVSELLHRIITHSIDHSTGTNKKQQDFFAFTFDALLRSGCVAWWQHEPWMLSSAA